MLKSESKRSSTREGNTTSLEYIGQGVRGRSIPDAEFELNIQQIDELVKESGSEAFADFLYSIYKIKPPKERE